MPKARDTGESPVIEGQMDIYQCIAEAERQEREKEKPMELRKPPVPTLAHDSHKVEAVYDGLVHPLARLEEASEALGTINARRGSSTSDLEADVEDLLDVCAGIIHATASLIQQFNRFVNLVCPDGDFIR